MNPYEMTWYETMSKMNDKQKADYKEAKAWLDEHWKEYSSEDFLDWYDFVEAPDEKREIYRNDSVRIMFAEDYDYFEILLNEEK